MTSGGRPLCRLVVYPKGRPEVALVGVVLLETVEWLFAGPSVVVSHQFPGAHVKEDLEVCDLRVVMHSKNSSGNHVQLETEFSQIGHIGQVPCILRKFINRSEKACQEYTEQQAGVTEFDEWCSGGQTF
jgi:hypothetical protein